MSLVLDASVGLAWCFEDEAIGYADRVLDRLKDESAIVPVVWPLEVGNGLCVAERAGRISPALFARATSLLESLPITIVRSDDGDLFGRELEVAREFNLSTYDASYLALAIGQGVPLSTLDKELKRAAKRAGVVVLR